MWEYNYDYLEHHGIMGQKWGIRRFQNADGSLTAAGKERYSSNGRKKEGAEMLVLFAPHALMAATYLGAAVYSAASEAALRNNIKKERETAKVDKKTGLKIKNNADMSKKDDMKRVNPDFYDNAESQHNCMLCTTAYDMRRRGYEVQARKTFVGYSDTAIKKWYPKAKVKTVSDKDEDGDPSTKKLVENTKKDLLSQGEGARGNLMNIWNNGGGGHSIVYEIEKGKIILRDCQSNTFVDVDTFVKSSREIQYVRLDNVDFDAEKIKEAIK